MNVKRWLSKNTSSLLGKKIAITGSTGGIGVELCNYLAELGASLILLDRNEQRSRANRVRLMEAFHIDVKCINVDLEDIFCVNAAVEILQHENIDYFIHNAGAYSIPRRITSCGYDNVFQINFVSPYYMIRRLMPKLIENKARVVIVGSIAHTYSCVDISDIDFHTRNAASKTYGNAKRYLMFSMYELFSCESNTTLSVTHPGITFTNITAHYPKLIFAIIKYPMKIIFMRRSVAALSILRGLFQSTKYGTWIGPWFFNVWGRPKLTRLNTVSQRESKEINRIADDVYIHCIETVKRGNV